MKPQTAKATAMMIAPTMMNPPPRPPESSPLPTG